MNRIISTLFTILLLACNKEEKPVDQRQSFVMSDKMLSTTQWAVAHQEKVKNQLNFFGKITADNNKMIEIFPMVGGNVTKVFVELGDFVHKGQLLATIRSSEVASFEKDMDDARNDLVVAKNNYRVTQELFQGKLNTERDVLEAKNNLEKAESQLHRVEQIYRIYNVKPGATYEVRSPLDGFVIQKNINQDMQLRSDKSDNIFDIAEINQVWALANINESEIGNVKLGIRAEVTSLSYPDKKFYGKVDKIYNMIDPETKAMKARVTLENPGFLLMPEMRVALKFSYEEDKSLIAIPSKSIVFDKSKTYVMIFKDKRTMETRQVEIYRQVGDITYVQSGVSEGEKVLTSNQLLIYDALND